jgi:hypothetical protein
VGFEKADRNSQRIFSRFECSAYAATVSFSILDVSLCCRCMASKGKGASRFKHGFELQKGFDVGL